MMTIQRSEDRGEANHGWLRAKHSFSFSNYCNPKRMGFGPLRVINEDEVAPGMGFGEHGHKDMEIVTYVLEGTLRHRDSMGNGSALRYGDVQRMSAGSGVRHSEFNESSGERLRLLQIWIEPSEGGGDPGYEEAHFGQEQKRGRLRLIASPDGEQGSVRLRQDARIYATILEEGDEASRELGEGRLGYLHVIRGSLVANGQALKAGDALELDGESKVELTQAEGAEALLFDLPK